MKKLLFFLSKKKEIKLASISLLEANLNDMNESNINNNITDLHVFNNKKSFYYLLRVDIIMMI